MVLLSPEEIMDDRIFDYLYCREDREWELRIRYEEFLESELSEIPSWKEEWIMDNKTIRNAFLELKENQKMVLTCSEHTYVLYHEDILCMGSGNDLQINNMYIDCTYVQCASIKNREDFWWNYFIENMNLSGYRKYNRPYGVGLIISAYKMQE